jgi:uncharacterized membrane protein
MKRTLFTALIVAAVLRIWYAWGLPLSGDEVGVGVLQATGQAATYGDRMPSGITSLQYLRGFIAYNPQFSVGDVLHSLRVSGMHPPLYYFALHYLIRACGSDLATLRAFSLGLSLGCILAVYCLGRALHSSAAGLLAACLLAVAPYGVIYGLLVRPYPMAMLFGIVSTTVAVKLARDQNLTPHIRPWLLYLTISILGLYTVYQYVFVLAFQVVYLGITNVRRPRHVFVLAIACFLVGMSYLPWIPSLRSHMSDVTSHTYYFHHALDLSRFAADLFAVNFPVFLTSSQPALTIIVIGLPFYVALSIGCVAVWRDRTTRPFAAGLLVYVIGYLGVERAFGMSTVDEPKFLFFLIPMTLVLASVGVIHVCRRTVSRSLVAGAAAIILLGSSIATCLSQDRFVAEGEESRYVRDFKPILNSHRDHTLLVVTTMQRRYLFPLVHALHGPGDVYVMREGRLPAEEVLELYRRLYLVNLYVNYEPETFLDGSRLESVVDVLRRHDFRILDTVTSGSGPFEHALFVFGRP